MARTRTRRRRAAAPVQPLPTPGPGERLWVLAVPFRERAEGAVWSKQVGAWVWVGAKLPADLRRYQSQPHTFERMVEDTLNGSRLPPEPVAEPMKPYPMQTEAVKAIAEHWKAGGSQFLLADDPGCGKTLSAVLAVKVIGRLAGKQLRVLVIADRPATITIGHWARTITNATDGGHHWCVVTWDHLKKVAAMKWDVVVADEGHMIRHIDTARWGYFARIVGYTRSKGPHPYLLVTTATPSHSPLELTYLSGAYADRHGETAKEWVENFPTKLSRHGVHLTAGPKWSEDAAERAQDTRLMRSWLTDQRPPAMLYRPAPWGPCPVSGMPVELSPAAWVAYEAAWGDFCREMQLARHGSATAKGRAALLRFRQKAGMLRVGSTVEWVLSQVAAGRQVAVSCEFVDTAARPIAEKVEAAGVPVARIYGGSQLDGEQQRVAFQTGACPVVVFTPTASLSLHAGEQLGDGRRATTAPRVGVFHQPRYSGIQGRQVVGRTHRDHQVSPWRIAYSTGTVEEQVAKVMVERYRMTAEQVGGDTTALAKVARLLGADWLPEAALIGSE